MKKGKFTLVMGISLLLLLVILSTTMANEVVKTEKIDLTGDGVLDTIKLIKGFDVANIKVFDGSTGKNIFPQNHYGHIGGMKTPRTYKIINGMIVIPQGDLRFGCTVIFYKYYPKFRIFMEEKQVSFSNPAGRSWDDVFSQAADEFGISLVGVRTVRIFFYHLQHNEMDQAKEMLNVVANRGSVTAGEICDSIKSDLLKNNNQYQLESYSILNNHYFSVGIYFPNPIPDAANCPVHGLNCLVDPQGKKITIM